MILQETDQSQLEEDHAMTDHNFIDPENACVYGWSPNRRRGRGCALCAIPNADACERSLAASPEGPSRSRRRYAAGVGPTEIDPPQHMLCVRISRTVPAVLPRPCGGGPSLTSFPGSTP